MCGCFSFTRHSWYSLSIVWLVDDWRALPALCPLSFSGHSIVAATFCAAYASFCCETPPYCCCCLVLSLPVQKHASLLFCFAFWTQAHDITTTPHSGKKQTLQTEHCFSPPLSHSRFFCFSTFFFCCCCLFVSRVSGSVSSRGC